MDFREKLGKELMLLDGGMGTMQIKYGLNGCPEINNLLNADTIIQIHKEYIGAGADIIETNTFGANSIKLNEWGLNDKVKEINYTAVKLAKTASNGRVFVAGSMGPTGKLVEPLGDLEFDEAYSVFREQAEYLIDAGVDLILIETMSVLNEARAALLAAKDAGNVPVLCSMTFDQSGRTLSGTDVETMVTVLEALGADGIGINCSLGPKEMIFLVKDLLEYASKPVFIQPNAGLPVLTDNVSIYPVGPDEFSQITIKFAEEGAAVLGGCCGTTPDHIKLLKEKLNKKEIDEKINNKFFSVASSFKTFKPNGNIIIIGECINPAGKKELTDAIKSLDTYALIKEAKSEVKTGADIIDVNVWVEGTDEKVIMAQTIRDLESAIRSPICIDTSNTEVMECALRLYQGKALLNSVNGTQESLEKILPMAKKYGAAIIGMTIDENGIPKTAHERLTIAKRIVEQAIKKGIPREDIMIDIVAIPLMVSQDMVHEAIKSIKLIKEQLDVKTVIGASNISYGFNKRKDINAAILPILIYNGIDAVITNPKSKLNISMIKASEMISGKTTLR